MPVATKKPPKRDEFSGFKLRKHQKDMLRAEAQATGMDVSKYMRLILFNEMPHIPKTKKGKR